MKRPRHSPKFTVRPSRMREAVEKLSVEQERRALDAALDAYIHAESGGPHDLDEALEAVGVEYLLDFP